VAHHGSTRLRLDQVPKVVLAAPVHVALPVHLTISAVLRQEAAHFPVQSGKRGFSLLLVSKRTEPTRPQTQAHSWRACTFTPAATWADMTCESAEKRALVRPEGCAIRQVSTNCRRHLRNETTTARSNRRAEVTVDRSGTPQQLPNYTTNDDTTCHIYLPARSVGTNRSVGTSVGIGRRVRWPIDRVRGGGGGRARLVRSYECFSLPLLTRGGRSKTGGVETPTPPPIFTPPNA